MKRALLLCLLAVAPIVLADDSPFLENTEKVEIKEPLLRVTRPSKDWTFMDLAVLKKIELKKAGSATGRVEDAFQYLKAELQFAAAHASFFVYAWPEKRENVDAERLGGELLEQTRGFFKEKGKVVGNAKTKLGKLDAWGLEVEGKLVGSDEETSVSKLVVLRAEDKMVFVLSLELPKKNQDQIKKDKRKLFTADVVKVQ